MKLRNEEKYGTDEGLGGHANPRQRKARHAEERRRAAAAAARRRDE